MKTLTPQGQTREETIHANIADHEWHIAPRGIPPAYCGFVRGDKPLPPANAPYCDICVALHQAHGRRLSLHPSRYRMTD